jgi:hypothetical protein
MYAFYRVLLLFRKLCEGTKGVIFPVGYCDCQDIGDMIELYST